MTGRAARVAALLVVSSALALAACGDGDETAEAGATEEVGSLEDDLVPKQLLGLTVEREDTPEGVADVGSSFLEAVALYSLRRDDLLQATLQVGRFREGVDFDDRKFRESLLTQVGSSRPQRARMGDDTVYLTTGIKQRLAIWFRGDRLLILGTREEFDRPRTLLREALELHR